ncbi:MAG TPA: 4Fe-4S dicluster domain-containing protein [Candidatus Sulfotelmatobacter sp.]|nr:4Fe-4S dicluster domain-containing protein [Candidatus Sulfotelmatobacter sp.]
MPITETKAGADVTVSTGPLPTCNRKPPETLQRSASSHRFRKTIHVVCVGIFFLLPFANLMRFDIPRQRFYFFGYELWISEFAIIFFSLMFLMFLVAAMAMLYGRVYCGYLCPQMIFSEASIVLESRLTRTINKYVRWKPSARKLLSKVPFYTIAASASVVLAFCFISYFVEPRDLFHRLLSLDIKTAGGIAGATTTLLTLLDFVFLRQRFCTTVCPYGYLQGMLGDGDTLIVQYRDEKRECIECKKCVRVCHMGIDIRTSPYQIECIHCGECIDACADVLARLGKETLIHYVWGEQGEKLGTGTQPWYRKIGLRNGKRVVVLLIILFYAAGLFTALSMRSPVLVRIAPDRTTMYRIGPDGTVYNRFRVQVANRGHEQTIAQFSIAGLPGTKFSGFENAVVVATGQTIQQEFEIAAPDAATLAPGVNHFRLICTVGDRKNVFEETFITPMRDSR